VAGTAAAGALLSVLRERSGSLAAPVLLHLTANCAGPLASAVGARLERRLSSAASTGRKTGTTDPFGD
jgi:membrane protease YdiL (CAAX protease family)